VDEYRTQIKRKVLCLMLSLEVCKKILNSGKTKYKDEAVKQLREYLYMIAELQLENENESK
jgi:hypothetical protein